MKNLPTQLDIIRAQYAYNRFQVCYLTGITDAQLSHLQFETGLAWLERHTGAARHLLEEMLDSPAIWSWWRNEWSRRDAAGILKAMYHIDQRLREAYYRRAHADVFIKNYPVWNLLEGSYAKAVNDFNDDVNQKRAAHAAKKTTQAA